MSLAQISYKATLTMLNTWIATPKRVHYDLRPSTSFPHTLCFINVIFMIIYREYSFISLINSVFVIHKISLKRCFGVI